MTWFFGASTRVGFLSIAEFQWFRKFFSLGLIAALSACADGYSQNESQVLPPIAMSQDQRVKGMNAVGKRPYLGERWRYKLNASCELKISTGSWPERSHSTWIPLKSVRIVKSHDKSDKTQDFFLQPVETSPASTASIPLMAGLNWADAVEFASLAQHAQRDCLQMGDVSG